MAEETIKATFLLSPAAKYRLASLKARLRREGLAVTESAIVEQLLSASNLATLEAELTHSRSPRKAK